MYIRQVVTLADSAPYLRESFDHFWSSAGQTVSSVSPTPVGELSLSAPICKPRRYRDREPWSVEWQFRMVTSLCLGELRLKSVVADKILCRMAYLDWLRKRTHV